MKVYVIPVDRICNGKCNFCITKFRDKSNSEFLDPIHLSKLLKFKNIDKIEITGGGEPCLNSEINKIIDICSKITKTSIYTNGTFNLLENKDLEICLSRIHYDDFVNESLMGIKYDIKKYNPENLKLSLMLHKEGINSSDEIVHYLQWAKKIGVKRVVIRKISFNCNWKSYEIAKKYSVDINIKNLEKIKKDFGDFVEFDFIDFDLESCNGGNSNIILGSDGNLYFEWNSKLNVKEEEFLLSYLNKITLTSTCLGRKVASIIMKDQKIIGIGSNSNSDCLLKKVCNRVITNQNEDYSNCLCTHAEINAINDALSHKNNIYNSKIFVYGHHKICPDCQRILDRYNIQSEIIA